MPAFVTVSELKAVLGVGNLYADADLQEICDSATNTVDGYLTYNRVGVTAYFAENSVATVYTDQPHGFVTGQTITLANVQTTLNGSRTITEYGIRYFRFATALADTTYEIRVKPAGTATGPQQVNYDNVPEVREAALTIAVDMWTNRLAPGGQPQAVDFTPSPYRMGRSTLQRVIFLLAKHIDAGSMVG